jgi:hypothetical protein
MTNRKIIILFALIGLSITVFAQPTMEKKDYYDVLKTQIKRIYNVNGNGLIQGDDKLYYKSGKIEAMQKWNNGRLVQTTAYFETGTLQYVKNYKDRKYEIGENEEPIGEQKFYEHKDGKHYQYLYINIANNEIIEFKYFDINGKITDQYKKDAYLKIHSSNFAIKNGYLSGNGLYDGEYSIDIKDGKLLSVEYAKNTFAKNDIIPYFEVNFNEKSTERTVVMNAYHEFKVIPIPFSIANNNPIPINVIYDTKGLYPIKINPNIRELISPQLKNTVIDDLLTITDFDKNVKEERLYEKGLLMWKIEYNKNGYAVIHTKREYKKPFPLGNENEIRPLLKYDEQLETHYIEPPKNDYVETYEAYNEQNNIVASTEIDRGIALQKQGQKEMANKLNTLKTEFNNLLGKDGFFTDPAANVKKLFNKLDSEYSKQIGQHFGAYADLQIPIKAEQAELYQSAINGLQKVGLKEFNKVCATITTKEELRKYLNDIIVK